MPLMHEFVYLKIRFSPFLLMFNDIMYYSLLIAHYLLLFIPRPSPDRNGYPAARVGESEGLGVGACWCEEYEWIAG